MNNRHKTFLNLLISFATQIVTIVLGLIVPRLVLVNYGSDVNGLVGTIGQVFTYIALLEAGIGVAARNKMFKPIKMDDKSEISYWCSIAQKYYRKISFIYLLAVLLLSFALPFVLKSEVGYWTIFVYILFEGLSSVVTFFFANSWICFLIASGKSYITNSISLLVKILMYAVKIVLTINGINIGIIQVGYFFISLVQTLIYYLYMKKKYSWIDFNCAPKNATLPDKNSYIVTEVAWTIFSSTDLIILSIFVSTSLSSVYSVYSMVFAALNGLLNSIFHSLSYNLGQIYFSDIEKYKKIHSAYNSAFFGIMTVMMCVSYALIIPFVKLYTSGINDVNYIYEWAPLLFCLIQMLSWSRYVSGNLAGIAGYAKQTSYISIMEAGINIVVSLILVNFFGLYGVLFATVVALPIKVIWCNWLAEIKILKRNPAKTIIIFATNWFIFIATVVVFSFVHLKINSYFEFFIYGVALFVLYCVITFLLNCIANRDLMRFKFFVPNKKN